MNILYWDAPAFLGGSKWLPGTLTPVAGGYVVERPDGQVLSIQPDGSEQTRPHGTAGPWETCTLDPKLNVLRYKINGVTYALVIRGQ